MDRDRPSEPRKYYSPLLVGSIIRCITDIVATIGTPDSGRILVNSKTVAMAQVIFETHHTSADGVRGRNTGR